ncbi:hypothetical protein AAAU16_06660 [Desulfovibrio piger]|uniref:hypothetical protein n=1 Tax=Desulfovibrio piger TaxID=901 RepID=UPI0032BF9542
MSNEPMQQQEDQNITPHIQPQNQNSIKQEQREADAKLLDIFDKRLDAIGGAQNRMGMFLLALCLVVFLETMALVGVTLWHSSALSQMQDSMEKQNTAVLTAVQKMDEEIASISAESKGCMERVKKYVWELKTALNLKFSQQRSGNVPQQAQDGEE